MGEGFYFGESGEHTLYQVAKGVSQALCGLGYSKMDEPTTFTGDDIDKYFQGTYYLGFNSSRKGKRVRALGWRTTKMTQDFLGDADKDAEALVKEQIARPFDWEGMTRHKENDAYLEVDVFVEIDVKSSQRTEPSPSLIPTATMSPELPTELLYAIASHLPAEEHSNRDALKALCLTSSFFRAFCQPGLFKHIRLELKKKGGDDEEEHRSSPLGCPYEYPGQAMFRVLTSSPHLIQHIEGVTLYEPYGAPWFNEDEDLIKALDLLDMARITSIVIDRLEEQPGRRYYTFPDLLPKVRDAFAKLCSGPWLSYLCLGNVPMELAGFCKSTLKHLDLRNPDRRREPTDLRSNYPVVVKYLEYLRISDVYAGAHVVLRRLKYYPLRIKLDNLKSIHIVAQSARALVDELRSIPAWTARTLKLESMTVQLDPDSRGMSCHSYCQEIVDATPLLTRLELWVGATYGEFEAPPSDPTDLLPAAELISLFPSTNLIKEIVFFMYFMEGYETNRNTEFSVGLVSRLRRIGQALSDPNRFRHLVKVTVELDRTRHSEAAVRGLEDFLLDAFGSKFRPGVLTLRAVERPFHQAKRKTMNPLAPQE